MKKLISAAALCAVFTLPATAQEDTVPNPAVLEQIALSEQLMAIGQDRNDALIILAAIKLRANLQEDALPQSADALTDRDAAFAAARAAAANDPALLGIVEDVNALNSRGTCVKYLYGPTYCY
ncbi:MAG: hypothetical protein AAF744_02415 [Pseudomonadota bacterium]